MTANRQGLIALFARHRVAANLLMALMVLAGGWALAKLNTQFFPSFELDMITVRVPWTGASAEDVESGITDPLEQELRNLDNLHRITSTSATGVSSITLEYEDGTNMDSALEKVNSAVARTRNLPEGAEKPEVSRVIRYETIARLLVIGSHKREELRHLVHRMRDELLAAGISKIDITGLPEEELAIQVPSKKLLELGVTLEQVARQVQYQSRDLPAGSVGRDDISRQLRSLEQRRDVMGFEDLVIPGANAGDYLTLKDIAHIERRPKEGQETLSVNGKPAVELQLYRSEADDSLRAAQAFQTWLSKTRPTLPPNLELKVYDEKWQLIKERISLLLTNGGGGLLLVVGILLLFLNARVALWVSLGIPVSFMTALAVLYLTGGSINMISLFGLIMALGIIVDDAIVVGEDALTHFEAGEPAIQAAEGGAYRMLAPVVSSSLTTVAAFLPLMIVGGVVGNIMFDIPLIVICVILASLIECFFVLPGHLRSSFTRLRPPGEQLHESGFRRRFERGFTHFRNHGFRHLVTWSVAHRGITLAGAVGVVILAVGLVAGGRIGFTFFPNIEGRLIYATVAFAAGTPPQQVNDFLAQMETSLYQTEHELGGHLITTAVVDHGAGHTAGGGAKRSGDQHGSIAVEMVSPEQRQVTNKAFVAQWEKKLKVPAGVESFTIAEQKAGHPGRDIDLRLVGDDATKLKLAATDLMESLKKVPGVSALEDDLPWGQDQLIYHLTPQGEMLGLDVGKIGDQLRAAYDGYLTQIYIDDGDEVEVRVMLPDSERYRLSSLDNFNVQLPNGTSVPLTSVASLSHRRGFDALRHTDGQLAVSVSGDVDRAVNNSNLIRANLSTSIIPELHARYGVDTYFQGRAEDQSDTLADLRRGVLYAFILMYVVLAWVFASYSKPFVVMAVIPFGLVGAIVGHWLLNLDLTILSLFGFFGLSGIVVNDSIILVTFYQQLKDSGMDAAEAVVEAACQRLRAVVLTSLTTIAGLTPLLFETSLQAQFLIPMAVTICFGLAFSTILVLVVIPTLLSTLEHMRGHFYQKVAGIRSAP
jgi:multidrug efflux pump subunit AcrB